VAEQIPSKLHLVVVTRERKIVEADVDEVILPAYDGEIGVLPGHTPLLAMLKVGIMRYRSGGKTSSLVLTWGFAEVLPDRVIVMADTQQSRDLLNSRQLYVSVSRARDEVLLFTDDHAALEQAVSRDVSHTTALEALAQGLGESRAAGEVEHDGSERTPDHGLVVEPGGAVGLER